MFDYTFEKFFHEVTSPYVWGCILLLALRAEYKCLKTKDYPHAAAFLPIIIGSGVLLAAALNMLPDCLAVFFA